MTRHIPEDQRTTEGRRDFRISPRTGKLRRRGARPRGSLSDKLLNMQLLLRAKSFSRWPLEVRFFAKDVFSAWLKFTEISGVGVREGINVVMDRAEGTHYATEGTADLPGGTNIAQQDQTIPQGLRSIHMGYEKSKHYLEKSLAFSNGSQSAACAVCSQGLHAQNDMFLVCPRNKCHMVSHLTCLARLFLVEEKHLDLDAMLPTTGRCPSCSVDLPWIDLVRDLSLRSRDKKECASLFVKPKTRRGKLIKPNDAMAGSGGLCHPGDESDADSEVSDMACVDNTDLPLLIMPKSANPGDLPRRPDKSGQEWFLSSSDFYELVSDASGKSEACDYFLEPILNDLQGVHQFGRVREIEDSDWESAEILE